jgi:DNA-binding transcriptional regulator YdaS (Cro superfamily)
MPRGIKLDTPAKRAIVEKGIDWTWLAKRLGISQSYLRHHLRGTYQMPPERAQRVADMTGLPIELFLHIERDQEPQEEAPV